MSDWRAAVGGNLKETLKSQQETDFVLTCSDGDVQCHRLILLCAGGLLQTKIEERLSDDVSRLDISVLNISKSQAGDILSVIYGGLDDEMTADNVVQFVHFAFHYGLKWFMKEIISKFVSLLTTQNVLQLYSQREISISKHLSKLCEEFCQINIHKILADQGTFTDVGEDVLLFVLNHVPKDCDTQGSQPPADHFQIFKKVAQWIISDDRNIPSSGKILSQIALQKIPKSKMQSVVYDFLFNQLIIGNSDKLSKEDKVLLSTLYQQALNHTEVDCEEGEESTTESPKPTTESPKPKLQVKPTERSQDSPTGTSSPSINGEINHTEPAAGGVVHAQRLPANMPPRHAQHDNNQNVESIVPYIISRSWQNMELDQVKEIVQKEDLVECEFLIVEAIMLWIASDYHHRKQYCEDLLRCCRFSSICPVYTRSVLTTFVTEKMLGSVRLAHSIFRQPSTPRAGSNASKIAGVCDEIPLSIQRLKLGNHVLRIKCSCGNRANCSGTLHVSRDIPTAVLDSFVCERCGTQEIRHTACSSTLTPDIFPSMYLLPFNYLSRIVASMDDMRIYFFV